MLFGLDLSFVSALSGLILFYSIQAVAATIQRCQLGDDVCVTRHHSPLTATIRQELCLKSEPPKECMYIL